MNSSHHHEDQCTEWKSFCRDDKTHAIKQGMMQQLLTGRVRLVEVGCVDEPPRSGCSQ